jgi:predicted nucleic acid-binding protein
LLKIVQVAPVGDADARVALSLSMNDLEDAFQTAAALAWKADFIVTRNVVDYKKSSVKAVTPASFLKLID